MNNLPTLSVALFAGVLLGAVFFGGLWWTIQRAVLSPHPALWFLLSLLLRTAITLTGFYFVSRRDWRSMLACLVGFLLARVAVSRFTRATVEQTNSVPHGAGT